MTLTAEEQATAVHYLQSMADLAKHVVQQPTPATEEEARDVLQRYLQLHFPRAEQLAELQRAALFLGGTAKNVAVIIRHEAERRLSAATGGN